MSINKSENQLLVEYALEDEEHLEIAIKTHFVFDAIRKTIIEKFVLSLENTLRDELGSDWKVLNELKDNAFVQYSGLDIMKKHWKKYYIRMQQEKSDARCFDYGVVKADPKLPHIPELKKTIDKAYKSGKEHDWWVWFTSFEEPYYSWNNLDILLALYRKNDAIDYLKRHLIIIARISEPIIDGLLENTAG